MAFPIWPSRAMSVARMPNFSSSSRRLRLMPSVFTFPRKVLSPDIMKSKSRLPIPVCICASAASERSDSALRLPLSCRLPICLSCSGIWGMFFCRKSIMFSESLRSSIFASQAGVRGSKSICPLACRLMSSACEERCRWGIVICFPAPWKEVSMAMALWIFFNGA